MLDAVRHDAGQAARGLRRAPGLTLVVVLTLGIALTASIVTFGLLNATLL